MTKKLCTVLCVFTLFLSMMVFAHNLYYEPALGNASALVNDAVKLTEKQAKALRSLNPSQHDILAQDKKEIAPKLIRVNISKLVDNQGQPYIGALVSRADLLPYLVDLAQRLGDEYASYRALQSARDHQQFHITLISSSEYQLADKFLLTKVVFGTMDDHISTQVNVTLLGLGEVKSEDKKTFFVVAQSHDAQFIRQQLLLNNKDFHVTLGFSPSDIYGVKKDRTTLVDKSEQ